MKKGLIVNVFRSHHGDCSANGISSNSETVLLWGEGVPEIFNAGDMPVVMIENHYKSYHRAVEVCALDDTKAFKMPGMNGPMFGGCFIWSSDSRFPFDHPIKLHDRFEAWPEAAKNH